MDGIRDRLGYECAPVEPRFCAGEADSRGAHNGAFTVIQHVTVRDLDGGNVLALVIREKSVGSLQTARRMPHAVRRLCSSRNEIIRRRTAVSMARTPLESLRLGALQAGPRSARRRPISFSFCRSGLHRHRMVREREALVLASKLPATPWPSWMPQVALPPAMIRTTSSWDRPGSRCALASSSGEPLVEVAFRRERPVQTIREQAGRKYIATAVGLKEPFGRYAGGVEVVGTKSRLYGLTDALTEMGKISSREQWGRRSSTACASTWGTHEPGSTNWIRREPGSSRDGAVAMGIIESKRFTAASSRSNARPTSGGRRFRMLRYDAPVIVVRQKYTRESLPLCASSIARGDE